MATLNTQDVYLKGKVKWVYAYQPDVKFDPPAWKVSLYPDNASLEIIQQLKKEGMKNWEKRDEDGTYYNFRRPTIVHYRKSGRDQALLPPIVLDKDNLPFTQPIGNGSDATIKLEVYQHGTPTGKAKAARFASIRIDNLVPFEKERDFTDDQKRIVAGLPEQPRPQPF